MSSDPRKARQPKLSIEDREEFQRLRDAASADDPDALYAIGMIYYVGKPSIPLEQNFANAFEIFQASEQASLPHSAQSARAVYMQAFMLYRGEDGTPNKREDIVRKRMQASELFVVAAEDGNADAFYRLAVYSQSSVKQNLAQSLSWYQRSLLSRDTRTQMNASIEIKNLMFDAILGADPQAEGIVARFGDEGQTCAVIPLAVRGRALPDEARTAGERDLAQEFLAAQQALLAGKTGASATYKNMLRDAILSSFDETGATLATFAGGSSAIIAPIFVYSAAPTQLTA